MPNLCHRPSGVNPAPISFDAPPTKRELRELSRVLDTPAYDVPVDPKGRARAIQELVAERRQFPKLMRRLDGETGLMSALAHLIASRRRRLDADPPDINLRQRHGLRGEIAEENRRDCRQLRELCGNDRSYFQEWLEFGERRATESEAAANPDKLRVHTSPRRRTLLSPHQRLKRIGGR